MEKQKKCRYCNKYYPESKFGVALIVKDKIYRRHKCPKCYQKTKKLLKEKYRKWLIDYKKKQRCNICNTHDHRVLEFHHINEKNKNFSIGAITTNNYGFARIKKEISKCKVLCANCHRILHYDLKKIN